MSEGGKRKGSLKSDIPKKPELERWIHHDIDNYEMDMSEDLLAELKDLERICRQVNRKMKKEAVEDAKGNK